MQSFRLLKNGGILAIEARGKKNSLYQKGQEVQKDAFIYEQHYRRFLDFDNSIDEIKNICGSGSFDILFSAEERGFAPYKNEDDYFIRIIAKKS